MGESIKISVIFTATEKFQMTSNRLDLFSLKFLISKWLISVVLHFSPQNSKHIFLKQK